MQTPFPCTQCGCCCKQVFRSELTAYLDKGIEAGNMDLVNLAMESITTIVKSSPLKEAEKIIQALNDPNIEKIEF